VKLQPYHRDFGSAAVGLFLAGFNLYCVVRPLTNQRSISDDLLHGFLQM
jgi:hypothetical protein